MPLFNRKHQQDGGAPPAHPGVPGLAEYAAAQGWPARPAKPFDGHLEAAVHEVARVLYGGNAPFTYMAPGKSSFQDAYGGTFEGRPFTVANAWTKIGDDDQPMSVCTLELPAPLLILQIRPVSYPPFGFGSPVLVGDPSFDSAYTVLARDGNAVQAALTPQARGLLLARNDWMFVIERLQFACLSPQPFASVEQVTGQIAQVHAVLAAMSAAG